MWKVSRVFLQESEYLELSYEGEIAIAPEIMR